MSEESSLETENPSASPNGAPSFNGGHEGGARHGDMSGEVLGADLLWVWQEVRKRVFIKLPFSRIVADALEAIVPITLDEDVFVCGLAPHNYPMSGPLQADQVRNTIEGILRHAAGRAIHFEIVEGTSLEEWLVIKERRHRAQEAVIAMAQQNVQVHHFEDILNQIVGEIRQRVTATKDRAYPQIRAALVLDIVPMLAAAEEMIFNEGDMHDARRAFARTIDRAAGFLEVTPLTLAIEVERHHRDHGRVEAQKSTPE